MEIRKDILGKTPMIGSIVCWNVPYTQIVVEHDSRFTGSANKDGNYSVRSDFVIVEL